MPLTIGPSAWWLKTQESVNYYAKLCPVGTTLPDGSRIICKNGVQAWIIAPASTQVSSNWANTSIVGTGSTVGNLPSVSCWATLCSQLLTCGFNPCDWFVPSGAQLLNPGYACRTRWDSFSSAAYWSSTETSATTACGVDFGFGNMFNSNKTNAFCVRAFRCVTY
jgi:hypothetical protein